MNWEQRGGCRYLYRSVRQGDRVVREYLGPACAQTEQLWLDDLERRAERERRDAIFAEQQARWDEAAKLSERLGAIVQLVVRSALMNAGYQLHGSIWRKSRNGSANNRAAE